MWLAPEQVRLATVADDYIPFAKELKKKLADAGVRVHLDDSPEKVGKKIREAAVAKVPWTIVLGEKEVAGGDFQIKVHGQEDTLVIPQDDLLHRIIDSSKIPA